MQSGVAAAGVADATAVICADDDDDLNLQIALLSKATQSDGASGGEAGQHRAARGDGTEQRAGRDPRCRRPGRAVVVEACLARTTPRDLGGRHRVRDLRNRRPARRHAAGDVRAARPVAVIRAVAGSAGRHRRARW